MRLTGPVLAGLVAVAMSGCMAGLEGAFLEDLDCTPQIATRSNQFASVLYPPAATQDPSPAVNPSLTVHAREGQTLIVSAVWSAAAGTVQVDLDGPSGNVTTTTSGSLTVWSSQAPAPAGNYTVTLQGDPVAFGVGYGLVLMATGCTSR